MPTTKWIGLTALCISIATLAAAPPPRPATTAPAAGPPPGIPRIKLWDHTPNVAPGNDTEADPSEPTMDIYLPPPDKATGTAMLVLPGGSYQNLAMTKEGTSMAQWLVSHNIAAFVVRYRHGPRFHYPAPLLDVQRTMRTVRSKATEFHIDPHRLGIIGFSAGGHLAASTAVFFNNGPAPENPDAIDKESPRPDFAVLMYPVITMTDEANVHQNSRNGLTGGDPALFPQLSLEQHVQADTPPIFLAQGNNDRTVTVMNSVLFYEACVKAQVPAELHIFENGPHGFGLAANDPALKIWPDLMLNWMTRNKWLPAAAK